MKARIKDHLEAAAGHIKTAAALSRIVVDEDMDAVLTGMAKGIDALVWDLGDGDDDDEEEPDGPDGPAPVFYRADLSDIDDLLSGPCWTA